MSGATAARRAMLAALENYARDLGEVEAFCSLPRAGGSPAQAIQREAIAAAREAIEAGRAAAEHGDGLAAVRALQAADRAMRRAYAAKVDAALAARQHQAATIAANRESRRVLPAGEEVVAALLVHHARHPSHAYHRACGRLAEEYGVTVSAIKAAIRRATGTAARLW